MSRRIAALAGLLLATSAASLTAAAVEADNLVLPPELTEVGARGTLDLSVEEAVALAIQHNASLRAERQQPIIAGTFAAVERAVFDPSVFATVERSREVTERVSEDIQQNFDVRSEQETARAGLRQTLPTGTELEISLEQDLSESNRSPRQAGTRAGLSITQALLRGFGIDTNLVALRQARADVQASAYELRGFVTSLVADVESTYWDYLCARRRIDILENALEVARRQSREARARIEAGSRDLDALDVEIQDALDALDDNIATLAAQRAELVSLQRDLDQFR